MKSVSSKGLIPVAISGLAMVGNPTAQTFKYNDVEQNNIQLINENALTHLKYSQGVDYGSMIHRFRFYKLFNAWHERVRYMSSPNQIINDLDFIEIVNMQYSAVPYIIDELEKEPSYLVWALNKMFGYKISDNPTTTISEASKYWLKYLKSL